MTVYPKDYDGLLKEYDTEKAEAGRVELISLEELKVEDIYVEGGENVYSVPAINLTKSCEGYEPEFILCFLPNEQNYATYDNEHWVLHLFDASWNDIKNNPIRYLNVQWEDTGAKMVSLNTDNYEIMTELPY